MKSVIEIIQAKSEEHFEHIRVLFREYAGSLGFDLCFQDFEKEYMELPGEYAPPDGRLFLAMLDNEVAGCAALRRIDDKICEMKRMYVKPHFRGRKIGNRLAEKLIQEARLIGYEKMRLDTVPAMTAAIALYQSLGFKEIVPYRYNPIEGAKFMELTL